MVILFFFLQNFASPMNQVQSRIWLMHWSLFIFFNHDNGRTLIIDLFNQDKYAFWTCQFLFYLAGFEILLALYYLTLILLNTTSASPPKL
jgi:hypothetical protein